MQYNLFNRKTKDLVAHRSAACGKDHIFSAAAEG